MGMQQRWSNWSGLCLAGVIGLAGCSHEIATTPIPPVPTPASSLAPSQVPASPTPTPQPSAPIPSPTPNVPAVYRVATVAGNGLKGDTENGQTATSTSLFSPTGVCQDSDGSLFIADYKINKIRKVTPEGLLQTIAGSSFAPGDGGEGGPATQAELAKPYCVVMNPSGHLTFSEYGYSVPGTSIPGKIRWIDGTGVLHRLAGGGNLDVANGMNAADANLLGPEGLVYDAEGNLYVAEYDGHRVDKIDSNGILTIVAGTGTSGNEGDGGLATQATLANPNWLAFDKQGNLVIVDSSNHNVRMVKKDGTITTIAGTGLTTNDPRIPGYVGNEQARLLGDGGPATLATFNTPTTAAFDAVGNLLVTDSGNNAIRKIDTQGIISTIAGTELSPDATSSALPDGTFANQVAIGTPDGIFINSQGQVFFSEYSGYRVRRLY